MSRELRSMSKRELEREVMRLRALLEQQMSAAPGVGDEITVDGIVSASTGRPVVAMRAGEASWQLSPSQARRHALIVLDKAVEAERDAATVAFLREVAAANGEDEDEQIQSAGSWLMAMRSHRDDWLEAMLGGR